MGASAARGLSDISLWNLLIREFGIIRTVRLLGWLQVWMVFPGRDLRELVEESSSFATSYRVLADIRRVADVIALAEGRRASYTLHDVAERLQAMRLAGTGAVLPARAV